MIDIREFEEDKADFIVPDWHIALVKEEIKKMVSGTAGLMDWQEAKKGFITDKK